MGAVRRARYPRSGAASPHTGLLRCPWVLQFCHLLVHPHPIPALGPGQSLPELVLGLLMGLELLEHLHGHTVFRPASTSSAEPGTVLSKTVIYLERDTSKILMNFQVLLHVIWQPRILLKKKIKEREGDPPLLCAQALPHPLHCF